MTAERLTVFLCYYWRYATICSLDTLCFDFSHIFWRSPSAAQLSSFLHLLGASSITYRFHQLGVVEEIFVLTMIFHRTLVFPCASFDQYRGCRVEPVVALFQRGVASPFKSEDCGVSAKNIRITGWQALKYACITNTS